METKMTIDMLTSNSVSIETQQYINHEGTEYPLGAPHRKAYTNSARGRGEISQELNEPYLSAVMSVWGEHPTIQENATNE